jgi:hypothetical protein
MAISIGQQSKMITKILRVNIKVPNWLQWWSLWKKELRKRQWAQNNGCQGSLHKWKGVGCRWVLCIGNIPSASIKDNYVDPSYNHATFGGKCDSSIVTFMSSKQEKKAFSMEALGETVPIKHLKSNPIVIIWREYGFSRWYCWVQRERERERGLAYHVKPYLTMSANMNSQREKYKWKVKYCNLNKCFRRA